MLLKKKVAVIYDADGAIGGVVAKTFARAGATVYRTGRRLEPVRVVADPISSNGVGRRPPKPTSSTRRRRKRRAAGRQLPAAINLYLRMQFLARPAAGRIAKAGSGESAC